MTPLKLLLISLSRLQRGVYATCAVYWKNLLNLCSCRRCTSFSASLPNSPAASALLCPTPCCLLLPLPLLLSLPHALLINCRKECAANVNKQFPHTHTHTRRESRPKGGHLKRNSVKRERGGQSRAGGGGETFKRAGLPLR